MKKKFKVLIGSFTNEANAHVPHYAEITNFDICFGDSCIERMEVGPVFEKNNVTVIPTIYADSGSDGVITRETFDYIESTFLRMVKEHLDEIDGIYLHLHGASEVLGLGSGDHHILKELRKVVGEYLPIMVTCDPHGNLMKEYVEATTLIRSYRESPHRDAKETKLLVAQMLCDYLKNRTNTHSVYRKLPLILGGEQSVSDDEPVKSINVFMDEMEKDHRILSASWHPGYIRHDSEVAGCGIVVVPTSEEYLAYAEEKADELAKYVWDKRKEFHYTGKTAKPDKAVEMAIDCKGKPFFITDSGDNVTSGSTGWNTYVLRQFLAKKNLKKTVLFASICDPKAYELLNSKKDGEKVHFTLGVGYDEMSKPVELDAKIVTRGPINGFMYRDHNQAFGYGVLVRLTDKPIDVFVASTDQPMVEIHQFVDAGIKDVKKYDIVIVKQGYIFWELKEIAKDYVMSLTNGATLQDTANLDFKKIMRPMFPVDKI